MTAALGGLSVKASAGLGVINLTTPEGQSAIELK